MAGRSYQYMANPRPRSLDEFVGVGEGGPPPPKVPMKRLTFDIPADLHRRMKLQCVADDRDMADVIRELLADRFPQRLTDG